MLAVSAGATAVSVVTVRHYAAHGWPLCGRKLMAGRGRRRPLPRRLRAQGRGLAAPVKRSERPGSHALAAANAAATSPASPCPAGSTTSSGSPSLAGSAHAPGSARSASRSSSSVDRRAALRRSRRSPPGSAASLPASGRPASSAEWCSRPGRRWHAAPIEERARDGFRLGRWLGTHTTSRQDSTHAWAIVSASWVVRALALYVLLGALGLGHSFPLALLFLTASAGAAVLPVGPAGTATQVGAGAAVLAAAGVPVSQAIAFGLAAQALIVLAGAAVVVLAGAWEARLRLVAARA